MNRIAEMARLELRDQLRLHGVKRGSFTLVSGRVSDWIVDCKPVTMTAVGHKLVGDALLPYVRHFDARAVAGVAVGGCMLASAVCGASLYTAYSEAPPLDALYVRKEAKGHGTGGQIVGAFAPGTRVVLLEDVVTTGGSSIAAIQALRQAGAEVVAVQALVDRDEGGAEAICTQGLAYHALFCRSDMLDPIPPGQT